MMHLQVTVRDLFLRRDLGAAMHSFTTTVPAGDAVMLRLTPTHPSRDHEKWRPSRHAAADSEAVAPA